MEIAKSRKALAVSKSSREPRQDEGSSDLSRTNVHNGSDGSDLGDKASASYGNDKQAGIKEEALVGDSDGISLR